MSVKVTLNCPVKKGKYDELVTYVEENLANVRGFAGCMRVSIFASESGEQMLIDEDWLSAGHHQEYIQAISQNGVLETLQSFLDAPPVIQYFNVVEI